MRASTDEHFLHRGQYPLCGRQVEVQICRHKDTQQGVRFLYRFCTARGATLSASKQALKISLLWLLRSKQRSRGIAPVDYRFCLHTDLTQLQSLPPRSPAQRRDH